MRQIKFRGKRVDNGQWVFGYHRVHTFYHTLAEEPVEVYTKHFIGSFSNLSLFDDIFEQVDVIPETVGQFTGLTDKNGKEIYEGDIVSKKRHKDPNNWASDLIHDPRYYSVVIFNEGCFMTDSSMTLIDELKDFQHKVVAEIIGNIHDNLDYIHDTPDLL